MDLIIKSSIFVLIIDIYSGIPLCISAVDSRPMSNVGMNFVAKLVEFHTVMFRVSIISENSVRYFELFS